MHWLSAIGISGWAIVYIEKCAQRFFFWASQSSRVTTIRTGIYMQTKGGICHIFRIRQTHVTRTRALGGTAAVSERWSYGEWECDDKRSSSPKLTHGTSRGVVAEKNPLHCVWLADGNCFYLWYSFNILVGNCWCFYGSCESRFGCLVRRID